MKAVHFGAGNIGRGFIGSVLQDAGYEVVFADVNDSLVAELNKAGRYQVIELGEGGKTHEYKNFQALNSISDRARLLKNLAEADVITASVGANVLPLIAEVIAVGLDQRLLSRPAIVMACENAVNATDLLAAEIMKYHAVQTKAIFCNTAVDRIVPMQPEGLSPSVEVEAFNEWVIETKNLKGRDFSIPGATMVADLAPYIERKLFTVNTAHCATAYLGQLAGYPTIASAMSDLEIYKQVESVLAETSQALIMKYHFDPSSHRAYVDKTLARLSSPVIDDQVERVGRQPLRKLSRNERLISPAAFLAQSGIEPRALLIAVAAGLAFQSSDDPEVVQLNQVLAASSPSEAVQAICGIEPSHPLHEALHKVFADHKSEMVAK